MEGPPKRPRLADEPLPVTVLTASWGLAGKTTLMNHILEAPHGLKFAIIENEFGEVGVDEKVIKEEAEEQIIEVMNGCICCTVRGDLVKVLNRLRARVKDFDGVIIETTGLADPAPVAQTFFVDEDIQKQYRLDGIITVVDAKHALQHLREEKPEGVENEAVEQVAFADRVILNKTDLASEEALREVEAEIRKINHAVEVIRAEHSRVDPEKLININAFSLKRVLEMDEGFLDTDGDHQHDTSVSSISWRFEGELNSNMLQRWISEMLESKGASLFRYKGVLAVKGMDRKFIFQGVHMLFSGSFASVEWKDGEVRESRFVFIGRNLDKKALEEGFMACKVTEDPRFKVGDSVFAKVRGRWAEGKVTKHWEKGNPYCIELKKNGITVHAPEDTDDFVRSAAEMRSQLQSK